MVNISRNTFQLQVFKKKYFFEKSHYMAQTEGLRVGKEQSQETETSDNITKKILRVQYRGKCTEHYARALHKINAPCTVVMTLRKLKTALPSLKPPTEKLLKSGIVYEIQCPRCKACYVGQTGRHLQFRLKEHQLREGPVKIHYHRCTETLTEEHIRILHMTTREENFLLALEALYIRERKPSINTRDEYRRRELKITTYYMGNDSVNRSVALEAPHGRKSMVCSVVQKNYMGSNV